MITRRNFTKSAAAIAACSIAAPDLARAQEKTVVYAGWGGSLQKALRKHFFDSFEKETGIRVVDVPDASLTKVKAMVDSGSPQWDIVHSLAYWIPQGQKANLWEELDYKVIDQTGIPDAFVKSHGIGHSTYGVIIAYNKESCPVPPRNWSDFWNLKNIPGRRGLFDGPRYTLEAALLADGVPMKDLYPLDMDRAFHSLDKIKKDIHVWWKQWPQAPILLGSQELAMTHTTHTRIIEARRNDKVPLEINWQQGLMTVDFLAVTRGTRRRDNAMRLIAWMLDPKRQADFARDTQIGPITEKASQFLSDQENDQLPLAHLKSGELVPFGNEWWADNEELAAQRWNSWKLT